MGKSLFYFSFFLILAGGAGLIWGTVLRIMRQRERVLEGETKAKVVDLVLRGDETHTGGFSNKYYPVFQYYANGKHCETVFDEGAYPAAWKIGQTVYIEYDREDPSVYRIRRIAPKDMLPTVLYAAGVGCVLIGTVMFIIFALRQA